MAKRRRLEPANPENVSPAQEIRTHGAALGAPGRAPIAHVTREAAGQGAFEEVAEAMRAAREEGRLIQSLPVDDIKVDHLLRDRIVLDPDEMAALQASLAARGQQTPIEVVALPDGGYGLISGLRRLEALKALKQGSVLALIRAPESADAAYVAMVEENEIRANLSFYERARVASEAARIGVYASGEAAVQGLFAHASASKRSKILAFMRLHNALGTHLRFPAAIPEKLGLALVKTIETTPEFGKRLTDSLRKTPAVDSISERRALERALAKVSNGQGVRSAQTKTRGEEVAKGVYLEAKRGRIVLQGQGLDAGLVEDLRKWLAKRRA
ncbi:ParB N-terminal domain-containing protein (plasmid) [Ruegeria sp. SCSIO 43209]|uniref:ParB/RepB/Spo0J family partition protein n=1 Tax=Ruegeria sp. SCSIO 43209 TaxID=2793010 RepID=UPI00147DFADD|nr:ParB N-terminal domain-containing protein [Ruegeria sp. SCSIO 43209]UAB91758.1 ParB N-terminal domain-containing protein [Ruegeria sp. SCSIO 43209]